MSTPSVCPHCNQPVTGNPNYCFNCGKSLQSEQWHQARLTPEQLTGTLPDVLKQYDTIAGSIITIAGVLASFYAAGIFAGKIITGVALNAVAYVSPLTLLLGAIISAVWVFYPRGYLTDHTFQEIIDRKERRLLISTKFFYAAIIVLIGALFIYLIRPA